MKKYYFILIMLVLLTGGGSFSVTYAQENNIKLNGVEQIIYIIDDNTILEEKVNCIIKSELHHLPIKEINEVLHKIDKSNLNMMERARLKSAVIRSLGFSNFDFKGTSSDVLAFKELNIEIIENDTPLILYRRSKANELESKYGLGYWWGDKERSIEETRNELAVLEAWGNPLDTQYKIQVPTGTKILKGFTASQTHYLNGTSIVQEYREGGAIQYWINKVDNNWLQ
ncbi:autotransporter [Bacillus cereus]|uniref:Autotransporter n=1 Tax=Bacillus cereus TaxID=1396 RepID=A0A9X7CS29_BACCE|nr:autotransporter [Bacillus cereus]PGS83524.1 autotransporter [Bacillus cereus]